MQKPIDPKALRDKATEILNAQQPCETFDNSLLPSILRDYINWLCETTSAESIMVVQSVLATLSSFIGKNFFIPEGDYFQRLYGNLWLCTVSPSGSFKTTGLNKGSKLAMRRQAAVHKRVSEIETALSETTNSDEKNRLRREILEEERKNVILPNRVTAEGLLDHLGEDKGGMLIASELGEWLETLEKKHSGPLKPLLTDFFDVPVQYFYKTRTQKPIIVNFPYITINSVSTAAWIQKNIKLKDVSSGFFARFLLFYPPQNEIVPPALPPPRNWQSSPEVRLGARINDLLREVSNFAPREVKLSDEAKQLFESMHNELYQVFYEQNENTQAILGPYVKRWSPYILKIGMIFELCRYSDDFTIRSESINAAKSVVDYAVKSTTHLFENELGESPHRRKCRKVKEYIAKKGGQVTRATLQSSRVLEGGSSEYDYVLESLETAGQINITEGHRNKARWLYTLTTDI